ncbi:MAG: aminopeptidase P family N-terminal domain-containing protein, partial [Asgard group archaeon]|nr:aminopeptidase P family N-terminal domain-containing protein [Asgard group archaeon]
MHKKRIQNLQQLMDKNDVDCLLLFAGVDLFYATNLQIHPSERPTIAIIPQNKEPILLCPGFEEKRMSETAIVSNIETWEEDENPFKKLRAILKSLGFEKSTIALDNKLWYEWYLKIEQQLTDVTFTNSTKIIQEARLIKSEAELNIMRK